MSGSPMLRRATSATSLPGGGGGGGANNRSGHGSGGGGSGSNGGATKPATLQRKTSSARFTRIVRVGTSNRARLLEDGYHKLLSCELRVLVLAWASMFGACTFAFTPLFYVAAWYDGDTSCSLLTAFVFSLGIVLGAGPLRIDVSSNLMALLVSAASLVSLLLWTVLTGVLFTRFSKPTSKIVHSSRACCQRAEATDNDDAAAVRPLQIVWRVANMRENELVDVECRVELYSDTRTPSGRLIRSHTPLQLVCSTHSKMTVPLTMRHTVTPDSPLYGRTESELKEASAMINVHFQALDNVYNQTIYASHRYYFGDDVVYGRRPRDIFHREPDPRDASSTVLRIRYDQLSDTVPDDTSLGIAAAAARLATQSKKET